MLTVLLAALEDEEDRRRLLALHDAYEDKLYRVALQVLRSPTLAEDAVQQSWVRIIGHFDQVKRVPREKLEGYLVVTARNTAVSLLDRERRSVPLPEDWDPPAPAEGTGEFQRLLELVRALPEPYRRVLELKCVLEYGNQEIAKLLGLPPSTVATHIFRGRAMLIRRLQEEGYDA